MDGPPHLLVKEHILGEPTDLIVSAHGDLAHVACPGVGLQQLMQQNLFQACPQSEPFHRA